VNQKKLLISQRFAGPKPGNLLLVMLCLGFVPAAPVALVSSVHGLVHRSVWAEPGPRQSPVLRGGNGAAATSSALTWEKTLRIVRPL
jgi:hypothetical protein